MWAAVTVSQDGAGSGKVVGRYGIGNGPFLSYGTFLPKTTAEFHCQCAEESRLRHLHPACTPNVLDFPTPMLRTQASCTDRKKCAKIHDFRSCVSVSGKNSTTGDTARRSSVTTYPSSHAHFPLRHYPSGHRDTEHTARHRYREQGSVRLGAHQHGGPP